jgi:hypothetical protein
MALSKVVKLGDRDYVFDLTIAAHKRVKAGAEVSLPDCVSDVSGLRTEEERLKCLDGFRKLMSDWDALPKVIAAMLAPQLEANKITAAQLDDLLTGAAFVACGKAITQSLIDFFHDDPRADLLRSAVDQAEKAAKLSRAWTAKAEKAMDRKMAVMESNLEGIKGDAAADRMILETSTNSLATLSESSRSILAPLLSES